MRGARRHTLAALNRGQWSTIHVVCVAIMCLCMRRPTFSKLDVGILIVFGVGYSLLTGLIAYRLALEERDPVSRSSRRAR